MAMTTGLPPFTDHLAEASAALGCSARLVGTGSYGFALALHEALEDDGLSPRFVEYGNLEHVVVQVEGRDCDARGVDAVSWDAGGRCPVDVDRPTLLRFAVDATGMSEAAILADRKLAGEVISAARELSGDQTLPPGDRRMSHLPEFLDHLHDAVDAAGVGFLFDEGGCYGMALALYAALSEDGLRPQFKDYDDLNHAVVSVLGKDCDYRGADVDSFGQPRLHPQTTTPEEFLALCVAASNWFEDKIEADRDLALDIIANAREMAAAPPAP